MRKFENDCVSCPPEMGCMGAGCPYRYVPHWYCDECAEEFAPSELRIYRGETLCKECVAAAAWDNADPVEE